LYWGGGLVNRGAGAVAGMPGADCVVGVDVGYRGEPVKPRGLLGVMLQSYDIMEWQLAKSRSSGADVMLRPDVRRINPAHMSEAPACIELGRQAALAALDDILALAQKTVPCDALQKDAEIQNAAVPDALQPVSQSPHFV